MSEELKATEEVVEVEKSEAEQLAEVLLEKADKSDLEGIVKAEQIEGFVKSEEVAAIVEKAVAEMEEKVEAKFAQAPAVITESKTEEAMSDYILKNVDEEGFKGESFIKAVNGTNSTTGAPVSASQAYADLVAANPFRAYANVFPVTSSSFKLPKLGSIADNRNQNAGSFTEGSAVSSTTVTVDHYNSLARIAKPVVDDVPGLDQLVGPEMVAQIGDGEATQIATTLDAATITETNIAATGPTLANLTAIMGNVGSQYWNSSAWFFNPVVWTQVQALSQSGTGSPLVIDPVAGGFTLFGRPVVIVSQLDNASAAGNNSIYFGDMGRGLVIGSRQEIELQRTDVESIGHITYWAEMRSGVAVRETAALARSNRSA